jgi:hypothetical protein
MESTGISPQARVFMALCGLLFLLWTVSRLRKRHLLVPVSAAFIGICLAFIVFAIIPNTFDQLAFALGIKYPPLLYEMAAYFLLIVLIADMAGRLSVLDERCRRLAQEIALLKNAHESEPLDKPTQLNE